MKKRKVFVTLELETDEALWYLRDKERWQTMLRMASARAEEYGEDSMAEDAVVYQVQVNVIKPVKTVRPQSSVMSPRG